jgi:threonine dehydratase
MDLEDVHSAAARTRGRVRRTPVLTVQQDDELLRTGGVLKLEMTQHTGSFKVRGAFNRLLAAAEDGSLDPAVGVVAASGGNAGLAFAYAAGVLGLPARVFVPRIISPTKLARLEGLGASVEVRGSEYADAYDAAMLEVDRSGALFCHAYDQLGMCAGAGTLGLELLDQLAEMRAEVDTVLVAVGGGGLLAGVATAVGRQFKVVGVEPVGAATLHRALQAGRPVDVAVSGVAADSLGARRIGLIAWDVARDHQLRSVLVSDDALLSARLKLWERYRLAVEVGAAAPLAALASGAYQPTAGERVAVVLCGGNTDPASLGTV